MSDTLSEFILARVEETEAPTFELLPYDCPPGRCAPECWVGHRCLICDDAPSFGGTVEAITDICREHEEKIHQRSRVLVRCAADRAIVALHAPGNAGDPSEWYGADPMPESGLACKSCGAFGECSVAYPCPTLAHVAAVWCDHPDYREEWKP